MWPPDRVASGASHGARGQKDTWRPGHFSYELVEFLERGRARGGGEAHVDHYWQGGCGHEWLVLLYSIVHWCFFFRNEAVVMCTLYLV